MFDSPPLLNPQALLAEWELHGVRDLRAAELKAARQLAAIDRARAWEISGASSIGHYGERCGLGADKARMAASESTSATPMSRRMDPSANRSAASI